MRKLPTLAGLTLLAGCAYPNPQHVAALNAMIGKSEADLVRAYGVPSRSVETGGSKFVAYSQHKIESFPDGPYWGGYGWHGGWGWWGRGGWGYPDIEEFDCETTFELKQGLVKGWNLRGNAC
jgi:hypothetical protein